mmetsp:Transcript_17460/g.56777  ORF Transcript_17460/g.56777 Transcript_17460/m.56777 type:complete len:262 (+) Transcript_17460:16-801(+)
MPPPRWFRLLWTSCAAALVSGASSRSSCLKHVPLWRQPLQARVAPHPLVRGVLCGAARRHAGPPPASPEAAARGHAPRAALPLLPLSLPLAPLCQARRLRHGRGARDRRDDTYARARRQLLPQQRQPHLRPALRLHRRHLRWPTSLQGRQGRLHVRQALLQLQEAQPTADGRLARREGRHPEERHRRRNRRARPRRRRRPRDRRAGAKVVAGPSCGGGPARARGGARDPRPRRPAAVRPRLPLRAARRAPLPPRRRQVRGL